MSEDGAQPRVRTVGITRVYPGDVGVRGIDLQVDPGQIHALVGLNGSGKTTFMRLLLGMIRPDAGSVQVAGIELSRSGPAPLAQVGYLVGSPLVYPELDTRTNLMIAARLHGIARDDVPSVVELAINEFGLEPYERVRARVLSQGNRQRLGLAGAMQHDPRLLVLDEPTTALDPAGVILLRESLLRRAEQGAGVLVSSHHLDEVARVADRITVLNRGRVIGGLDPAGVDIERAFFALVHDDEERSG